MRKCPGCGQNCQDGDIFCEACGTRLEAGNMPDCNTDHMTGDKQEYEHEYSQEYKQEHEPGYAPTDDELHDPGKKPGGGKSPVPVIIGCVAAAAVIITVTVACVTVLNGKKEDAEALVSKEALKEEEVAGPLTSDEDAADDMEEETGENQPDGESEKEDEREDAGGEDQEEQAKNTESTGESVGKEDEALPGSAKEEVNLPRSSKTDATETEEEKADEPETDGDRSSSSDTKYETYYVVNCHESITLRKSPSTSAGEICQIPFGAAVSYVGTAENGFYKIIYNGKTGYGLASYLDTAPQDRSEENTPSGTTDNSSAVYMKVVHCHESITLRKIPSTKGEEFCQIPLGSKVEYLGTAENGFYMVSYNGYTGYALASYLTEW